MRDAGVAGDRPALHDDYRQCCTAAGCASGSEHGSRGRTGWDSVMLKRSVRGFEAGHMIEEGDSLVSNSHC
jgi:hypothetical protein